MFLLPVSGQMQLLGPALHIRLLSVLCRLLLEPTVAPSCRKSKTGDGDSDSTDLCRQWSRWLTLSLCDSSQLRLMAQQRGAVLWETEIASCCIFAPTQMMYVHLVLSEII